MTDEYDKLLMTNEAAGQLFGFDYKSIRNELAGTQSSRDELRVFRLGVDVDGNDAWSGRSARRP